MTDIMLSDEHFSLITSIIKKTCPNAVVWAYGSRIKGDAHAGSDLDITVKDFRGENVLAQLNTALKESSLPFLVDVSYFEALPKSFQEEIKSAHVVICE